MARSPAHRFGQIIGEVLESAIEPLLEDFARAHDLFLDKKGARACRRGGKCTWTDANGNQHDLDFVLERGGGTDRVGVPVAFIETAWRRYTKHSRNKAQEIQGAIEPLAETYRASMPFKGAILAGVFTAGSLSQLRSLGFIVLHVPLGSVVEVFGQFGIDAQFDEATLDAEFQKKVDRYNRLSKRRRNQLAQSLVQRHATDVQGFLQSLDKVVSRQIERILVIALHGNLQELRTVDDAVAFVRNYAETTASLPLARFEIEVQFGNGDTIRGSFADRDAAIAFLNGYRPPA